MNDMIAQYLAAYAELRASGKTVSQICRIYHHQNCDHCEDRSCGDNTNPTLKMQRQIENLKKVHAWTPIESCPPPLNELVLCACLDMENAGKLHYEILSMRKEIEKDSCLNKVGETHLWEDSFGGVASWNVRYWKFITDPRCEVQQ